MRMVPACIATIFENRRKLELGVNCFSSVQKRKEKLGHDPACWYTTTNVTYLRWPSTSLQVTLYSEYWAQDSTVKTYQPFCCLLALQLRLVHKVRTTSQSLNSLLRRELEPWRFTKKLLSQPSRIASILALGASFIKKQDTGNTTTTHSSQWRLLC